MAGPWEKYQAGPQTPAPANGPWSKFAAQPDPAASLERDYGARLQNIRETQFPDMSDESWAEYSATAFPPSNARDLAEHSQLFGLTDEINAGLGALGSQVRQWTGGGGPGFGEAYEDYKALEESRRDLGREQQGALGTAAEVVGGLSTIGPSAATNAAQPLWLRALVSGGEGAALGGAYSAGAADEDRWLQALIGAGIGGGLGAGFTVAAEGIGAGIRNLRDRWSAGSAARQAETTPEAARFLSETMAADDSLSAAGQARMAAAGDEAMLADAGQSAQNALDYAIQKSGRAGRIASEAIDARVGRDAQALQSALDDALGLPQGAETLRATIRQETAGARGDAYRAAYDTPIDYSSPKGMEVENILRTRVDQSDINAANNLIRRELGAAGQSRQIMATVADDGSITYQRMPDVRQIDYITRALRDRAEANAGLGKMGGQTNEGRIYGGLASDLRGAAREAVPEYGAALETAADPIRRTQAVEFGADLLRPGTTREQVAQHIHGATGPERDAMRQGIRSYIDDTLANVTRTVSDGDVPAREAIKALRDLSSRASREKLTIALGKTEADRLFAEVDRIAKSFELRAGVADNSKTFQRQEMERRVQATTSADSPVRAAAAGRPINAGQRAIQALTGETAEAALGRQDRILEEVAKMLTARGQSAVTKLDALRFIEASRGANNGLYEAFVRAGGSIAAPAALTGAQQQPWQW